MSDDLKLPQVGELTFPQWQDWLLRYNSVLSDRESRIEKLETALRVALPVLKATAPDGLAVIVVRQALEEKDD